MTAGGISYATMSQTAKSESDDSALSPETVNGKSVQAVEYEPTYSRYFAPLDIRPERVFAEVIQRDKSLCSNCYRDRWDYEAVEFRCGELGWLLWERRYPIPGRNDPDLIKDERHDGRPLCCSSCGFETGQRKGEVATRDALHYACNISKALDLRGYDHDPEILLRAVRRHKSISEMQGKRHDIFGQAVTEAVRYARHMEIEAAQRATAD